MDSLQAARTVSRQPGKFPDGLESFHIAWKVSIWLGQSPDGLESFQIDWKVSRWPGQFPDGLESFQTIWKVSRWPGKFPDGVENIQIVLESFHIAQGSFPKSGLFDPKKNSCLQKLSRFTKTFQVALLPCYLGFSASAVGSLHEASLPAPYFPWP